MRHSSFTCGHRLEGIATASNAQPSTKQLAVNGYFVIPSTMHLVTPLTLTTAAHVLLCLLQQSPGFPEIEPDAHVDWNSQASSNASTAHPATLADSEPDNTFFFRQQEQSFNNAHSSNLIWESAGLVPQLQLPVLVPQDKTPPELLGAQASPRSSPSDMPNGPSIATARVHHPFSSTESAALTQLRAELNALFVESQNGQDLSLVPLPRQLSQATAAKATSETPRRAKMVRPNRLQARPAAPALRRNSLRRHTIDTTTSHQVPRMQPAQALQQKQVPSHPEQSQPDLHQYDSTDAATCRRVESKPAEQVLHSSSHGAFGAGVHGTAAGTAQTSPRGKRYARSNSWAAGSTNVSSPTRVGVTQSSTASTSYSK